MHITAMSPTKSSAKPPHAKRGAQSPTDPSADELAADQHEPAEDEPGEDQPSEPEYTIDELTAETGVPSRTIRFYQSSGVLPKPIKRGRIAYYSPLHIERLELIGKMQDRGLRMRAIKDLVEQIDAGEVELAEWLGLEQQLSSAWVDDAAKVLTRAELDERLGERRPGFIAELARGGLLDIQSDNAYLVPSPGLLQLATRLDDVGVGVDVSVGAAEIMQKHLTKAARDLSNFYAEQIGDALPGTDADDLDSSFAELRSASLDAVRLIFAREMEQTLRKLVETGEAARLDKKQKRRKSRSRKRKSRRKSGDDSQD